MSRTPAVESADSGVASNPPLFQRTCIIGVGLLGGSLGMALRNGGISKEVIGVARSEASIEEARRLEAIDSGTTELVQGVADCDLVVLCTPVRHIIETLPELARHIKPGAIVTDVGSTKANIVRAGEEATAAGKAFFVGSHPMAGSEKSGVRHARASFYSSSTCFVTRTPNTNPSAFTRVCHMWDAIGARLVISRPERHDRLVATISHLPHLVAVALVRAIDQFAEDKNLIKGIIGNGFRDTTRIAAGDSNMWEDICTDNREEITRAREALETALAEITAACSHDCGEPLRQLLEEASEYRHFLDNR